MKLAVSTLTLAACLAVGMAATENVWSTLMSQVEAAIHAQTVVMAYNSNNSTHSKVGKPTYCNRAYKDFIQCSVRSDFAGDGVWKAEDATVCVQQFQEVKDACEGTGLIKVDKGNPPETLDFPATLAVGGSSGSGYQGYYIFPEESTRKIYPLNCNTCVKFAKRVLACAVSLTEASLVNLIDVCLPTGQDILLASLCAPPNLSVRFDSSYVRITPSILLSRPADGSLCKSVEAIKTNNGNWAVKVRKDSSVPPGITI